MTPEKPPPERPEFSPLSLLRMVWKHKLSIITIWVVLSLASLVVVFMLPAIYKAETLILVDSQKIPEKYVTSTVGTEVQDRLATISQQILSATRLQKVIQDFNLYEKERRKDAHEEIIEMMRKDINITIEKGWTRDRPGAFRISYQGPNPPVVAEVANRLATFYIDENLRARETQAEGTTEFIENQLQQAKKTLDELEAKVSQYKLQHNGELPQQENSLNGTLARLQLELQGNQDAINRAQQNKLSLEHALSMAEISEATLVRALEQAATTSTPGGPLMVAGAPGAPPRKKSEVLQAELASMRPRYSDDHPEIKRLRGEITRVQDLEAKEAKEAKEASEKPAPPAPPQKADAAKKNGNGAPAEPKRAVSALMRPEVAQTLIREQERVPGIKTQLALAERELQVRNEERQRILRNIDSYEGRLGRLPIREQEMAGVTRDYEMAKINYKSLLDKKISAEMATEMERRQKAERFTVLDAARVPEKPVSPNRPLLGGLACVVSLALGLAIAVGRELKRGAVLGDWELPDGTFILGRVPTIEIEAREWAST